MRATFTGPQIFSVARELPCLLAGILLMSEFYDELASHGVAVLTAAEAAGVYACSNLQSQSISRDYSVTAVSERGRKCLNVDDCSRIDGNYGQVQQRAAAGDLRGRVLRAWDGGPAPRVERGDPARGLALLEAAAVGARRELELDTHRFLAYVSPGEGSSCRDIAKNVRATSTH